MQCIVIRYLIDHNDSVPRSYLICNTKMIYIGYTEYIRFIHDLVYC